MKVNGITCHTLYVLRFNQSGSIPNRKIVQMTVISIRKINKHEN